MCYTERTNEDPLEQFHKQLTWNLATSLCSGDLLPRPCLSSYSCKRNKKSSVEKISWRMCEKECDIQLRWPAASIIVASDGTRSTVVYNVKKHFRLNGHFIICSAFTISIVLTSSRLPSISSAFRDTVYMVIDVDLKFIVAAWTRISITTGSDLFLPLDRLNIFVFCVWP